MNVTVTKPSTLGAAKILQQETSQSTKKSWNFYIQNNAQQLPLNLTE